MFARVSEWSVPPERKMRPSAQPSAARHSASSRPERLALRASSSTAQLLRVDPEEERAATDVPPRGWRRGIGGVGNLRLATPASTLM